MTDKTASKRTAQGWGRMFPYQGPTQGCPHQSPTQETKRDTVRFSNTPLNSCLIPHASTQFKKPTNFKLLEHFEENCTVSRLICLSTLASVAEKHRNAKSGRPGRGESAAIRDSAIGRVRSFEQIAYRVVTSTRSNRYSNSISVRTLSFARASPTSWPNVTQRLWLMPGQCTG